jgi:hypothetical protein
MVQVPMNGKIWTGFIFSVRTLVGHGHIQSSFDKCTSAAEALIGLLSFAIATGLFLWKI